MPAAPLAAVKMIPDDPPGPYAANPIGLPWTGPGSISLIMPVPPTVPSLFHSSSPVAAVCAVKYIVLPIAVHGPVNPLITSVESIVVTVLPSVVHRPMLRIWGGDGGGGDG